MDIFKNRKLIIATKHKKEAVIAPLLEEKLGVNCFVDEHFDSDTFGTFSGEIERQNDALETVRAKCLAAMEINNCDLAVASEGSFGPHPNLYFAHADDEIVMLLDKKNQLEIVAREISLETNFDARLIKNKADLVDFIQRVQFPSHALIVKKDKTDHSFLRKGIQQEKELMECVESCFKNYGQAYIETDMRAMFNPTRMEVIKNLVNDLIIEMNRICPSCNFPGFSVSDVVRGLLCSHCHWPTKSVKELVFTCKKCHFSSIEINAEKKMNEDPMYCEICNP